MGQVGDAAARIWPEAYGPNLTAGSTHTPDWSLQHACPLMHQCRCAGEAGCRCYCADEPACSSAFYSIPAMIMFS